MTTPLRRSVLFGLAPAVCGDLKPVPQAAGAALLLLTVSLQQTAQLYCERAVAAAGDQRPADQEEQV